MIEHLRDGVIVADAQGMILDMNPAAEDMVAASFEELQDANTRARHNSAASRRRILPTLPRAHHQLSAPRSASTKPSPQRWIWSSTASGARPLRCRRTLTALQPPGTSPRAAAIHFIPL